MSDICKLYLAFSFFKRYNFKCNDMHATLQKRVSCCSCLLLFFDRTILIYNNFQGCNIWEPHLRIDVTNVTKSGAGKASCNEHNSYRTQPDSSFSHFVCISYISYFSTPNLNSTYPTCGCRAVSDRSQATSNEASLSQSSPSQEYVRAISRSRNLQS